VSASDRERPLVTGVNGPLMARQTEFQSALMAPWSSPVLLDSCRLSGRGRCVKAREATACGLALTQRTRPRQSGSEEDGTISRGSGSGVELVTDLAEPGSVLGPDGGSMKAHHRRSMSGRAAEIRIGRSASCPQSGIDAIVRYRPASP